MISTTVVTRPEAEALPLVLRLRESGELIDQLDQILWKYQEWNDPLSQELMDWGLLILTYQPSEKITVEEFRETAKEQLDKLETKILINPLTGDPLQRPLLDRQWVWEEWMQEDYLLLSNRSPFDAEEMEIGVSHDFASEVISWLHKVRKAANLPSSRMAEFLRWDKSESRLDTYLVLAQTALSRQNAKRLENMLRAQQAELVEFQAKMRAAIAADKVALEAKQKANKEEVEGRITAIEKSYENTANQLKGKIQQTQITLIASQAAIAEVKAENANHHQRITRLLRNNEVQRKEIQRLRDKIDDMGCVIL